jgi:hypothetical protein
MEALGIAQKLLDIVEDVVFSIEASVIQVRFELRRVPKGVETI